MNTFKEEWDIIKQQIHDIEEYDPPNMYHHAIILKLLINLNERVALIEKQHNRRCKRVK